MKPNSVSATTRGLHFIGCCAVAGALAGCGPDCSNVGAPFDYGFSFSVDLSFSPPTVPVDLKMVLTGEGSSETITWADIEAAADPDQVPCNYRDMHVLCGWGSGSPGTGTFVATASGYQSVNLELTATSSCGQTNPARLEATLEK